VHNENLPPLEDAVVTLTLDNETKTDTIRGLDATLLFKNIPHRFLDKEVRVQVACQEAFLPIDTTLSLSKNVTLDIRRNPDYYGQVRFQLWNSDTEKSVANVEVLIDGHMARSDGEGYVSQTIPLVEQKIAYPVCTAVPLQDDTLHMPCGPNDILVTK
jgi:hypothetical protein